MDKGNLRRHCRRNHISDNQEGYDFHGFLDYAQMPLSSKFENFEEYLTGRDKTLVEKPGFEKMKGGPKRKKPL